MELSGIYVRHEEGGAITAPAVAEFTRLACCAGGSGPGHIDLINGLYQAVRGGLPVWASVMSHVSLPKILLSAVSY